MEPVVREHLPGERRPRAWTAPALAAELAGMALVLLLRAALALPFWPIYLLVRLGWGRPPNVPRSDRFVRFLRAAMVGRPPAPGLRPVARLALALRILQRWIVVPFAGLAWHLDDVLYGRRLRAVAIVAPLFEVSAARSGSTQLAHYLEDDPDIVAPNLLQCFFPYLWLWKLAPRTIGRLLSRERVRQLVFARVPAEHHERHEMDPFRTDTFEVMFMIAHLGDIALSLGPGTLHDEYAAGRVSPGNRVWWEEDFVRFVDGVARKTLLHSPGSPRLMIKGHFLSAATALAARYPDARFLTVLRAPDKRIQSGVNFLRAHPTEPICGPVPWAWLTHHALVTEVEYCDAELDWIDSRDVCVVRFDDYVRDLPGTMAHVYRECLGAPVSAHVPTTHAPRVRTNYSIDRPLEDVGVDAAWLRARLARYYARCLAARTSAREVAR